jgi:hypothetical protein
MFSRFSTSFDLTVDSGGDVIVRQKIVVLRISSTDINSCTLNFLHPSGSFGFVRDDGYPDQFFAFPADPQKRPQRLKRKGVIT